jgi:pyochelin biosynthetic protein PchC
MASIRLDLGALAARALDAAAEEDASCGGSAGRAVPPWYVFGHSMGAVTGYVMAGRLGELGYGAPSRFIASSFSVPGWHPIPPGMELLPAPELWRVSAERFGVLNGQPIPSPEQMAVHTPVYRADLTAVAGYRPEGLSGLGCPVTVVYAESDMVDRDLAARWAGLSPWPPEIVQVPGGHFHPLELPARLEELILARLR